MDANAASLILEAENSATTEITKMELAQVEELIMITKDKRILLAEELILKLKKWNFLK